MREDRRLPYATLVLISVLLGAGGSIGSVFAWHTVSFTTTQSRTSAAVGTAIWDTANLQISNNGAPFGYINFYVYYTGSSTTCTGGTLVASVTNVAVTSAAENSGGHGYSSGTVATTSWSAGNYYWLAVYHGGEYTGNGVLNAPCEKFNLFAGLPPPGVPQFSFGLAFLFAVAIPALLLTRRRASIQVR